MVISRLKIFLKHLPFVVMPFTALGQQDKGYLDSLQHSLSGATSDTVRMEVYKNIGSYYSLEDRDSSSAYLDMALSLARKLDMKLSEASILNKLGILQMQQEKYSRSLEFYLNAIHIAKDPATENTAWLLKPGQSPERMRMLELSRSYDFIGLLNAYTGNWTDNINNQVKNYREAEKYANASGDPAQIASVIFHLGIAYMNAGKLDSALSFLGKARESFSALKDPQLGRAFIYTGEAYEKMGDLDLAAQSLRQALALLNKTNDNVHRGLGYLSLSRIYAAQGKTDSALYCARESFRIFEKRRDPAWKRDALNLLASYFEQLGKTDSATAYLKMAKSLGDSLSTEERKNLLAFQDILIGEQAKLEKLEKEKIEAREKLRTYLFMSGIVVVVAIALFLYRNNRVRKKTNELLQQRNQKIENTLHQLRSAQAQLIQSEKMASLGELTAGIAHEIQNPLNFVNNFSEVSAELIDEMKDELKKGDVQKGLSIAEDLQQNLAKINHHGKRADAIVKGMLEHSRAGSGGKVPTDINALADEYLRLAYHGLRAKDKSFNADLVTQFDPSISLVHIVSQDIGRVLLNLINNAFYAVNERRKRGGEDFTPVVKVVTEKREKGVAIRVQDNGDGIPEAIKEKIFQPFFTTKPAGQGTGLGLSLAYDIVKAHGGELTVESVEGEGTVFTIRLPDQ